ncbi:hypothetical protein, partial [Mycobacterium tuberculosis]
LTPSSAGLARPAFTPSSGTFDWSLTGPASIPKIQRRMADHNGSRQAGRCFRAGQEPVSRFAAGERDVIKDESM